MYDLGPIVGSDARSDREFAYDRQSHIGTLGKGDEAQAKGWAVVSMKNDWKDIFPATTR